MIIRTLISVVLAYLIGCMNGALIYSYLFRHEDIRHFGSGNAGSTNVLRVYGALPAISVFAFDAIKGVGVMHICFALCGHADVPVILTALAVICGHDWPVFTNYKGGKGIATTFGIAMVMVPGIGCAALAIALTILFATRIMALGTLTAVLVAAISVLIMKGAPLYAKVVIPVLFVMTAWQHRGNIDRILHGKENKLDFGKKER